VTDPGEMSVAEPSSSFSKPHPLIPTGFYYDFRLRRCPLRGQVVWLGAYRDSQYAVWASQYAVWASHQALHVGISTSQPLNAFVRTFTAFRAVFQVVGRLTRGNMQVDDRRLLAAALGRIWPPRDEPIDWPPRTLAFGDESLAELAQSIKGYMAHLLAQGIRTANRQIRKPGALRRSGRLQTDLGWSCAMARGALFRRWVEAAIGSRCLGRSR
jgi:hypothetical protein